MPRIASVVVLYNPDLDVIENIKTYSDFSEKIYAIDNSEIPNTKVVNGLRDDVKIKYVSLKGNLGIAKALNVGLDLVIKEGVDWALTMDQDSSATAEMLPEMIEYIENNTDENLAIVSPFHCTGPHDIPPKDIAFEKIDLVMTSGNLLKVSTYQKVGPFLEKLFIDYVDTEYCLRLRKGNYNIIRANQAVLKHQLGNTKTYDLFLKNVVATNHNSMRRYYITRNRVYLWRRYKDYFPDFVKEDKINAIKEAIKILFVEKDKWRKLQSIIKGYFDSKKL